MIINHLSLEVENLLECWQNTAYGLGVRTCAEHAWSPGSVPASKINNRLYKVVAIFTLALESSHVTRLSIGSCFTVTLDSDDARQLRQISSGTTKGSSLGSCAASWITNISPTCLVLSDFIPAGEWSQAHTALGVLRVCPCGVSRCADGDGTHDLTHLVLMSHSISSWDVHRTAMEPAVPKSGQPPAEGAEGLHLGEDSILGG